MGLPGVKHDILIIDDTVANLQLLSQLLTGHGYKVRAVRDGAHAIAAAQAAPPDLILLDIVMPGMDGYEVCRHLKEDERTRDIPILFISALGTVEDKVKAFTTGGVDYVTKPFQTEEVLARVRTHLALRDLTRQLSQQLAELQERNAELDAFAHTVAHDIKGPLSMLVGYAELLEQDYQNMPERTRRESIQALGRGALSLTNIVDELLLLASIRKLEVIPEPLDMKPIVHQAYERLEYLIRERHAEINMPSHWPQVLGHALWVEEVWFNYLSNGCKYGGTPPRLELGWDGPVHELVTRQAGEDALTIPLTGPQIRFWVRDNGKGIAPADQARLFIPFTRLNQVHVKGHGLGLSIVRRIVEKLNGQVGVESDGIAGHGSRFYFTLPVIPNSP